MGNIKEWIANFEADVASRSYTKLGIKAHQCTPLWVADQIISYLKSQIEQIENPHFSRGDTSDYGLGLMNGFDQAKLDILGKLQ